AVAVAEGDELLAQQLEANGRPVALHLGGEQGGDPVAPHQVTHYGAGADTGELHAFLRRRHLALPMANASPHAERQASTQALRPSALHPKIAAGVVCADNGAPATGFEVPQEEASESPPLPTPVQEFRPSLQGQRPKCFELPSSQRLSHHHW